MEKLKDANTNDTLSASVLLLVSILICIGSLYSLPYGAFKLPGPGFLPFWSGLLLGLMSLGLLVRSISRSRRSIGNLFSGGLRKPLFIFCSLLAYSLLFQTLGYVLCNFLFTASTVLLLERRRFVAFMTGSITAFASYLVFDIFLRIPLPKGVFSVF